MNVETRCGDRILTLGIVTYNNPATHLRRLLQSIEFAAERLKKSRIKTHVFIIDCGEPTRWESNSVTILHLPSHGNLGFGGGHNHLLRAAFADPSVYSYICINPDGILHRDLLVEMCAKADECPKSLIEARQFPEEHPKNYDPVTGSTLWASGACLMISRKIYRTIGGFDPNIFMYVEDVEFSWRARLAGFEIHVAPRALFGHSVMDRKPSRRTEQYCYLAARYVAYKWGNPEAQRAFEHAIREHNILEGDLPALPQDCVIANPEKDRIADFKHSFTFSPQRWWGI